MNIGQLVASLGVDTSRLRAAAAEVRDFGTKADEAFARAGSAASDAASRMNNLGGVGTSAMNQVGGAAHSVGSSMLGLIGITLSVAGAFALAHKAVTMWYSTVWSGIEKVEELKKTIIGTSYILTAMSDVKKPDLSAAYGEWKEYFEWMHKASIEADKKSAAGAKEIFTIAVEMRKKGVTIATPEDMDTIGRLTDLMKAVTPTYANLAMQARGEIEAMMNGISRMGAQTAMILKQIDPNFDEMIKKAKEMEATKPGAVLEYMRSLLPEIIEYTRDMMSTWDAVSSSMRSAWDVVQVRAFTDAHKDVVRFVGELANRLVANGELTAEGARLADELGVAWSRTKISISDAMDYVLNNLPEIIDQFGTFIRAISEAAVGFARMVVWLEQNISLLKDIAGLLIAMKVASWAVSAAAAIAGVASAFTATKVAADAASAATVVLKGTTIACTEATVAAGIANNGLAASNYLLLANANGAVTGIRALGAEITVAAGIAKANTVAFAGLATVIGGLITNLMVITAGAGIYGAYKTFKGETGFISPEAWTGTETAEMMGGVTIRTPTGSPMGFAEGLGATETLASEMMGGGSRKNAPPTPKTRIPGKEEAGEAGKGASQAADRIASIIDTLDKELARLTEGKLSEIEAWKTKMINDIEKVAAKGAEGAEAKAKAEEVAEAKVKKVYEEFGDWYSKELGDQYAELVTQREKKLKEITYEAKFREGMTEAQMAKQREMENKSLEMQGKVREVFAKKQADIDRTMAIDRINLMKGYIDELASATPFLSEQLALKGQSLELEIQIAQANLDQQLSQAKITQDTYDQATALNAVVAQAKRYSMERESWMHKGYGGGLMAYGMERQQEMETRDAKRMIDTLKSAESWISESAAEAFLNVMKGKSGDIAAMFEQLADAAIKKAFQIGTESLFDLIPGWLGVGGAGLKPTGTPNNPYYVSLVPGGGLIPSVAGLFGGGGSFSPTSAAMLGGGALANAGYYEALNQGWEPQSGAAGTAEFYNEIMGQQTEFAGNTRALYQGMNAGMVGLTGQVGGWAGTLGSLISGLFSKIAGALSGGGGGGGGFFGWLGGLFGGGMSTAAMSNAGAGGFGVFNALPGGGWAAAAEGLLVNSPTLSMIGEGRNPEAVVPLVGGKIPLQFAKEAGGWRAYVKVGGKMVGAGMTMPAFADGGVAGSGSPNVGDMVQSWMLPQRSNTKNQPGGHNINVNMTIQTPDVKGFSRSRDQVASELGGAVNRAMVRNR